MTDTDAIPFSERYEKWLDQCAMEFKNPARVKSELARFVDKLRREDDAADAISEFHDFGKREPK